MFRFILFFSCCPVESCVISAIAGLIRVEMMTSIYRPMSLLPILYRSRSFFSNTCRKRCSAHGQMYDTWPSSLDRYYTSEQLTGCSNGDSPMTPSIRTHKAESRQQVHVTSSDGSIEEAIHTLHTHPLCCLVHTLYPIKVKRFFSLGENFLFSLV